VSALFGGGLTGGVVAAALLSQWAGPAINDTGTGQDIPGIQGPQGEPGAQGPAGPAGQDGADGQDGVDGQDGQDGATGPQGPAGPAGADGEDGADGQDGQDGVDGQNGVDGQDGQDGATGPQGPAGPAGPGYIDLFIEDFWTCDLDALESGGLVVDTIALPEPRFGMVKGTTGAKLRHSCGPVAFRAIVPQTYSLNPTLPLTLRLYLFRCDASAEGEAPSKHDWDNTEAGLSLCIVGKRLLAVGSAIQDFGVSRTVAVAGFPVAEMRVIDLPLGAGGLECPNVNAGDFLAFEMDTMGSNAVYRLLGAEIFSWDTASLASATVVPLE
jgi:hypothetical protein